MKSISMGRAEKVAVISGVACAVFAGFLLYTAVVRHSVSFYAGGILAVSRSVTGFLVAAGIGISRRHTRKFNLGLYKVENLVVTVIGILVLFGAYELGRLVFFRMQNGEQLMTGSQTGIPVLLFASLFSLVLAVFKNRVGRKENCPSLRADARHSFIDALAMVVIAMGVGLSMAGFRGADSVAAVFVILVVFRNGARITIDGIRVLLDASVESGLLERVEGIVKDDPRVRDIVEISGRNSGSHRFFALKLVPVQNDLEATTAVTKDLRSRILKEIRNTGEISIEYTVETRERQSVALPVDKRGYYTPSDFKDVSCFTVFDVDLTGASIFHKRTVTSPFSDGNPGDGIALAVMLARQGVDAVVTAEPLKDKDVQYTLEAYGIESLLVSQPDSRRKDTETILREALKANPKRLKGAHHEEG